MNKERVILWLTVGILYAGYCECMWRIGRLEVAKKMEVYLSDTTGEVKITRDGNYFHSTIYKYITQSNSLYSNYNAWVVRTNQ